MEVVISGSGLWKPQNVLTNEELVDSYNAYVHYYNQKNHQAIAQGVLESKMPSSVEFIVKASGIRQRYIYSKDGVTDINRMRPDIRPRSDDELSDQAQMAVYAAQDALSAAEKKAHQVDAVIVSCAYTQRAYPAIAIEVQHELGIKGFAFDMLVACSSATFALQRAREMIIAETATCVLVINPELTSPQVNYTDRESHFIFGDVATAVVVENGDHAEPGKGYRVLSARAMTDFSNNIRSNFGYLLPANDQDAYGGNVLFKQNGRRVFKDVCPLAAEHIKTHLAESGVAIEDVSRWWLHQANINMNRLISRTLLNREADPLEVPTVLDEYANTASAGSVIAFHLFHDDLDSGEYGMMTSFGAGYSIGSLLLQKR